jgi:hypothetical protein
MGDPPQGERGSLWSVVAGAPTPPTGGESLRGDPLCYACQAPALPGERGSFTGEPVRADSLAARETASDLTASA